MNERMSLVAAAKLSGEQEPAVLALQRDVVVTAGAGAGKTRTLVGRYLALLEKGTPPRRIAAITFTRKAAREMRNRVRDEVDKYTRGLPAGAPESAKWEGIQRELDAARIGTIHELCAQILRTHPAEAGIDPRFQMLEEGNMAWLQS
ncbi:MAG: UvrD-helicase domain-containing protein, partial [Anaerolineae bacterium]|nr:UvrD-helicase domain-containing protein [Anaerolineae bacterium]